MAQTITLFEVFFKDYISYILIFTGIVVIVFWAGYLIGRHLRCSGDEQYWLDKYCKECEILEKMRNLV